MSTRFSASSASTRVAKSRTWPTCWGRMSRVGTISHLLLNPLSSESAARSHSQVQRRSRASSSSRRARNVLFVARISSMSACHSSVRPWRLSVSLERPVIGDPSHSETGGQTWSRAGQIRDVTGRPPRRPTKRMSAPLRLLPVAPRPRIWASTAKPFDSGDDDQLQPQTALVRAGRLRCAWAGGPVRQAQGRQRCAFTGQIGVVQKEFRAR